MNACKKDEEYEIIVEFPLGAKWKEKSVEKQVRPRSFLTFSLYMLA